MHRVIVVGSPRANGRSAALAEELFNACIEECPEDGVSIVSVASIDVRPCHGCNACSVASEAPDSLPEDDDNLAIMPFVAASDALLHRCVIHDDMTEVRKHIDAADELIVVCPVYFSGAPAQMKALMDRLQPYFWSDVRRQGRRPLVLHVVGEGGDPHGFEPLIATVRSSFVCAGFDLELVLDWVGKIDADGEIVAEADEYPIPPIGGFVAWEFEETDGYVGEGDFADEDSDDLDDDDDYLFERFSSEGRPQLNLAEASSAYPRSHSDGRPSKQTSKSSGTQSSKHSAASSKKGKPAGGKRGSGRASYGKNTPKKGGKRRG